MRSKYNVATEPSPVSGDPSQDYFSDGLTEEMIAQLRLRCATHVGVIARRCRHTLDMDRRFTAARRWLAASLVQWAGWMRGFGSWSSSRPIGWIRSPSFGSSWSGAEGLGAVSTWVKLRAPLLRVR